MFAAIPGGGVARAESERAIIRMSMPSLSRISSRACKRAQIHRKRARFDR